MIAVRTADSDHWTALILGPGKTVLWTYVVANAIFGSEGNVLFKRIRNKLNIKSQKL